MIWALHGAFGAPTDWDHLEGMRLDLRAMPLWERMTDMHSFGSELAAHVREEGDATPSVMGYSMGGRLALHAMVAAPDLWKSAIIVSAHPGLVTDEEKNARLESDAVWAKRVRSEALGEVLKDWDAQAVFRGRAREYDHEHLEAHREAVARGFEDWSLGRQASVWPAINAVTFPVLWITGKRDETFTALAECVTSGMPDASHVTLRACGHRVPWEDPDGFARLVARFQSDVESPSRW